MEVFRLADVNFTTLDGQGGLYGSGRWHDKGSLVTYAASSRALAVLERFIHDSEALKVPNLRMITVHIPDEIAFKTFFEGDLPKGWDTTEVQDQGPTQKLGTAFLKKPPTAFLKVPSAIIPHEYNYILSPLHPDSSRITVVDQHDYRYDERYKRIIRT